MKNYKYIILFFHFNLLASGIDDIYNLSDKSIPGRYEPERERKICIFPFYNFSSQSKPQNPTNTSSLDYLTTGIPGVLVTELRKISYVYDENVQPLVARYSIGKKGKEFNKEKPINQKKLNYSEDEWNQIREGKLQLKPYLDPRYISLKVEFFRDDKPPLDKEEGFILGRERDCHYTLTGRFEKINEDRLKIEWELTNHWDGNSQKNTHSTSIIRAFQELNPVSQEIRRILVGRDITFISIETTPLSGALVFMDGFYIGKTPIRNYPIPPGLHEIEITEPGYVPIHEEVQIETLKSKNFVFNLKKKEKKAYISVESNPPGADVFLGIEKIGTTPLEKVEVSQGKNRLKVEKEGYISYYTGVDLKDNINHKFSIELKEGDSDIYYKNKDYVFLDYTYKDFSTYFLWSSLLFYMGHVYFQIQANRLEDSIRPQIQIVNFGVFQEFNNQNPNQARNLLIYEEWLIRGVRNKANQYRRIAGNFGIQRGGRTEFQDGPMLYGVLFSLATSLTFLFLGLDREAVDIGFFPLVPLRPLEEAGEGGNYESRGFFQYTLRF